MNHKTEKAHIGRRLLAFYIDHMVFSITILPALFILDVGAENRTLVLTIIIALCHGVKDLFGGAGIGKRALRMAVRYANNPELKLPWYMLFLRNILTIIWPIELIMLLVKKRRIGDHIVKSDVFVIHRSITNEPV